MLKVFNKYYTVRSLIFFCVESGLIFFGIWCAISLTRNWTVPEQELFRFNIWVRVLIITFVLQLSLYYNDLYEFSYRSSFLDLSLRIIQAIGVACLILAALYYLIPELILRQGIFFLGLFFLMFFLVSWRYIYQYICKRDMFNDQVILVGDGDLAQMISQEVQALDSGFAIAGVFSNNPDSELAQELGVAYYSDFSQLCPYAKSLGVKSIIMAL